MTLVAGLRAASYGFPFQPVAGVFGSDLPKVNDWKTVKDPYTGSEVYVIPAIRPDVAVIHVNAVDEFGNARELDALRELDPAGDFAAEAATWPV